MCVFLVTDFSAEDKARGVKFCRAVPRRPRVGNSTFWGTLLRQKPKISDESNSVIISDNPIGTS